MANYRTVFDHRRQLRPIKSSVSAPTAPSGLTATPTGIQSIGLAWTPGTGQTSQPVEYSANGGAWTLAETAGAADTSYTFTSLPLTKYLFRVRGTNGSGSSAWNTTSQPANSALYGAVVYFDARALATLYQDSALTTPVATDGDPIGGWLDQTSGANNLLQTTSGQRPTYAATGISGLPAVEFTAANNTYLIVDTPAHTQPVTTFSVLQLPNTTFQYMWSTSDSGSLDLAANHSAVVAIYSGASLDGGGSPFVPGTTPFLLRAIYNGASSVFACNGSVVQSGDAGTNTGTGLIVGNRSDLALPCDGLMSLKIQYPGVMSDGDITAMETAIMAAYGIS